jgi:hypothetical protein
LEKVRFFLYLLFLQNWMDNLPSNLTCTWMGYSSNDGYQERMICLDMLLLLLPHQTVAFLGSISAITNPLDIQIYVSWYHAIATQCIVVHAKFDNGLSISILRNICFFPKIWISIFQILKFCRKKSTRKLFKLRPLYPQVKPSNVNGIFIGRRKLLI